MQTKDFLNLPLIDRHLSCRVSLLRTLRCLQSSLSLSLCAFFFLVSSTKGHIRARLLYFSNGFIKDYLVNLSFSTMSPQTEQPLDLYADHSGRTTIAIGFGIALPVVAVSLRLLSRFLRDLRYGPDDYMIIVAAVCCHILRLLTR